MMKNQCVDLFIMNEDMYIKNNTEIFISRVMLVRKTLFGNYLLKALRCILNKF